MSVEIDPALNGLIGSETRPTLDGIEFRIDLLWLAEESNNPWVPPGPPDLVFEAPGAWSCDVRAEDGTVLIQGQLLRHGVDILAGMTSLPGMPPGALEAFDFSGNGRDPGRADLDPLADVRLVYRTAAELGR